MHDYPRPDLHFCREPVIVSPIVKFRFNMGLALALAGVFCICMTMRFVDTGWMAAAILVVSFLAIAVGADAWFAMWHAEQVKSRNLSYQVAELTVARLEQDFDIPIATTATERT